MLADRRYEQGLAAYASQFQIPPEQVAPWFAARVGARFGEETILAAGGAWRADELRLRDRSLVVAALITQGGAEQQLRARTRWAIRHGCMRAELEALATLLSGFAGYPRAANGLLVVREELAALEGDDPRADATRAVVPTGPDGPGPRRGEGAHHA